MTNSVALSLAAYVSTAKDRYEKLVILAGGSSMDRTAVLKVLAEDLAIPVVNIGIQLSELLLEVTPSQRPKKVGEMLQGIMGEDSKVVILDHLEVLFSAELRQDPLRLLKSISKTKVVVAAWPGKLDGKKLIYAKPGHPEFQSHDLLDLLYVEMD